MKSDNQDKQEPKAAPQITVHFYGPLGHRAEVKTSPENYWNCIEQMGALGHTSSLLPPKGGWQGRLSKEKTFNWNLIGAKPKVTDNTLEGVWWRGQFYTRREMPTKKNARPAVAYTRGAGEDDPPEIIKESGGIGYVWLMVFRD